MSCWSHNSEQLSESMFKLIWQPRKWKELNKTSLASGPSWLPHRTPLQKADVKKGWRRTTQPSCRAWGLPSTAEFLANARWAFFCSAGSIEELVIQYFQLEESFLFSTNVMGDKGWVYMNTCAMSSDTSSGCFLIHRKHQNDAWMLHPRFTYQLTYICSFYRNLSHSWSNKYLIFLQVWQSSVQNIGFTSVGRRRLK